MVCSGITTNAHLTSLFLEVNCSFVSSPSSLDRSSTCNVNYICNINVVCVHVYVIYISCVYMCMHVCVYVCA